MSRETLQCAACMHTECSCDCATCEVTRQRALRGELEPCNCVPCHGMRGLNWIRQRQARPPLLAQVIHAISNNLPPDPDDVAAYTAALETSMETCPDCNSNLVPTVIDQPGISGMTGNKKCPNPLCISRATNRDVHVATEELSDLVQIHVGMCAKLSGDGFKDEETGAEFMQGLWALERRLCVIVDRIRRANRK